MKPIVVGIKYTDGCSESCSAIRVLVAVSTCRVWVPLGSSTHGTWGRVVGHTGSHRAHLENRMTGAELLMRLDS